MSWRGNQPDDDQRLAVEWAERLQTNTYVCKVCGWLEHNDGCAYDSMLEVCCACARRVMNLYHKKHSGEWWDREAATDQDFAFFYEDRNTPVERLKIKSKAKIKTALRLKVYERDGFKCVYCGSRKDLSLDHVTPEVKGGLTTEGNLVTACRACNTKKKTKSLADFWETLQ